MTGKVLAVATDLAASTTGGSANIGHRRRERYTKSRVKHLSGFYGRVQSEPAHRYCELIEEPNLSNQHRPSWSPLLQESNLCLPFNESVISAIARRQEPERSIGEFDLY
jgi:hypothetical protein